MDGDAVPVLEGIEAARRIEARAVAGDDADLPAAALLLQGEVAEDPGADDVVGVKEMIREQEPRQRPQPGLVASASGVGRRVTAGHRAARSAG